MNIRLIGNLWRDERSRNWMLVNAGAFALATGALFVAVTQLEELEEFSSIALVPFAGLFTNAVVGTSQAVLLRRYLAGRQALSWAIGSAIAGLLGWWLAIACVLGCLLLIGGYPAIFTLAGPLIGLVMGGSIALWQFFILRNRLPRPRQWIWVSALGRLLGWVLLPMAMALGMTILGDLAGLQAMSLGGGLAGSQARSAHIVILVLGLVSGAAAGLVYGRFTVTVLRSLWQPQLT